MYTPGVDMNCCRINCCILILIYKERWYKDGVGGLLSRTFQLLGLRIKLMDVYLLGGGCDRF